MSFTRDKWVFIHARSNKHLHSIYVPMWDNLHLHCLASVGSSCLWYFSLINHTCQVYNTVWMVTFCKAKFIYLFLDHMMRVATWLVFMSSRENISQPGTKLSTTHLVLGTSPLSSNSLRSYRTDEEVKFKHQLSNGFIFVILYISTHQLPFVNSS